MIDTWRLKNFNCHGKALSDRPVIPVSKGAGPFRLTAVVATAAWALGTVKNIDAWHFPFVSFFLYFRSSAIEGL